MTKHRAKPSVWDRSKQEPLPETERAKLVKNIGSQKIVTVREAASYLKVSKAIVNKFIEHGVLELMPSYGRSKLISTECLRGLLRPVNSLNKRLKLLAEITAEVNDKIRKKQEKLNKLNNEDNRD